MKLKNFFFAALAATFAFASCEQADPNGETNGGNEPAEFVAGDYWIVANDKVATTFSGTAWWAVENAVDGKGYADNAFSFVATDGGYNIKDAKGNYIYVGTYNESASQKLTAAATLPEGSGVWIVELQEDGTCKIVDVKWNVYLQFTTYGNFGAYPDAQQDALLPVLVGAEDAQDRPIVDSPYKSTLEWVAIEEDKAYTQKANVNSLGEVSVLKLGTSSVVGKAKITVPAGSTKLSFWGVAWKGKSGEVVFKYGETSVTQAFTANAGATSNPPYTIELAESDNYEITFSPALTADTEVTIESVTDKTRVILGGFKAE